MTEDEKNNPSSEKQDRFEQLRLRYPNLSMKAFEMIAKIVENGSTEAQIDEAIRDIDADTHL